MARPNFFNDNANRTFPFILGTAGVRTPAVGTVTMRQLPDDFIVDCGFIMGPESGFVEGQHRVYLQQIARIGANSFSFEFRCDAPNLADIPLVFFRNLTDDLYTTSFEESDIPTTEVVSESLSVSQTAGECGEPFWSGYLTTGDLTAIADRLNADEKIIKENDNEVLVEPSLIQNLNECQLVSLSIANGDRTRALKPDGCPQYDWTFNTGENYVTYECMQGDIRLKAGYNVALTQDNATNTIQFNPVQNAGLGTPCGEIPLFDAETPPIGAENELLAGDFYCNEVFRTINGLQGPNLVFFAGTGISIFADQGNNSITIDVSLVDLNLCTYSAVSESV